MSKSKMLKEAIADAKAVRSTAMANAKAALEEAFTPKLQSMISAKMMQEMDDEDLEGEEDYGDEMDMEAEVEPEMDMEADVDDEFEAEEELGEEDEFGAEEEFEAEAELDGEAEVEDEFEGDDEDLELEAIIRELEGEEESYDDEDLEEAVGSTEFGTADNKQPSTKSNSAQTDDSEGVIDLEPDAQENSGLTENEDEDEDIDINEIIAALREDDSMTGDGLPDGDADAESQEEDGLAEELAEAYNTIKVMKESLNETNLLNAKLMFSNKLFKTYDLNESQKLNVIDNFDRAQSLREVKLVYTTLAESMKRPAKRKVNESASRVTGTTAPKKQIISESNKFSDRMQKLAGLKK
jgi:hypothetical protein